MFTTTLAAQDKPPTDDAILQILRRRIDGEKKGVAIVVGWVDEHGSRVIPYGRTTRDSGTAADDRTMFEIGSVSKVFTSLLLAIAVEKGEVKLDDPLEKYVPPGTRVPARNGRQITLLDLATHRSGLPRLPDNMRPKDPADPYADYTPAQMYGFLPGHTLRRDPGAEYEYSNYGAALLGQALARRAGKTYEELVAERICQPLGLKSTSITLTPDEHVRLAAPYQENLSPAKNWNMGLFAGAGGLRSDVEDMLRFVTAELGLTPSPLAGAMAATQQPRRDAGGPTMDIGLGWHVEHRPEPVHWHNGGTGGYHTFVGFDLAHRRGVVILSNSANSVDDLGFKLLHPPRERVAVPLKPDLADKFVGRYALAPDFVLTFSREGDHCYLQATGQGRNEVFPESDTDFFLKAVDAQISFLRGPGGTITGLVLHQNGDQTAKRLP